MCVTHTSSSPCYSTHFALQALTPRASDPTAKKKKARPAVMAKRPEAKEVSADKVLPHEEKSKEPVIPSAVVKLSQQIEVIAACTYVALGCPALTVHTILVRSRYVWVCVSMRGG